MASRSAAAAPAPRLYLVTPKVENAEAFARALESAVAAADIAAVLLRIEASDERGEINIVKRLAPIVQAKGAALLIDGNAQVAVRGGADGAHLSGLEAFAEAASSLKPTRIAGIGSLSSRHDAMEAAERGAEYVMFGEPDAEGHAPPLDAICERIAWWSEVFEVPCVGYAASGFAALPIAAAGAEFVALGPYIWNHESGPAAAIRAAATALAEASPAMESA